MGRKIETRLDEGEWVRVAEADQLLTAPSFQPAPVAQPSPSLLPTHEMIWEDFERLLVAMARHVDGATDVRLYGKRGQRQYGIDLVAFFPQPRQPSVYQAKRQQEFGAADLEAAVERYAGDRRPFGADRIVVAAASEAHDTATIEKLYELRSQHADLQIDLWDRTAISEQLRRQEYLVRRFFGMATAEAFCDSPQATVATGVGSIEADAILRGPVAHLGLQDQLRKATELRADEPSKAADLFAMVADGLDGRGFRPHAAVVRDLEAAALHAAGRLDDEAWVRLALAWQQLAAGDTFSAKIQVRELAKRNDLPDQVDRCVDALGAAIGVESEHKVTIDDLAIAFDALQSDDPHFAEAALAFGEHAVARRREDLVAARVGRLHEAADALPATVQGERDAARLRMCIADGAGDWELLGTTARMTYSPPVTAWVQAREARFLALKPEPDAAARRYLDAIERACIQGLNDDAADWLYAMRDVRVWAGMIDGINDPHRHAQALRAAGSGSAFPESYPARERGLNRLREEKWADALEALRRYVWRAAVVADLGGEVEGNELLGDVFVATGRLHEALRHYVISGKPKKLAELAHRLPEQSIDISTALLTPRPWERVSAYKFVEEAADLISDESGEEWCRVAIDDLLAYRPMNAFAADPWRAAFDAFGRLAAVSTDAEAQRFIEIAAPLVEREPKHYRFSDEAHVRALIAIARRHSDLAPQAIEQLLSALLADQRMADLVLSEGADLLRADPERTIDRVGTAAEAGNFHAALAVVLSHGRTDCALPVARQRFQAAIAPRERKPGVFSFGTLLPDTAILMTILPPDDRVTFARAMVDRANDAEDVAANCQDALLALRPIAAALPDGVRDDLFQSVLPFAKGEREATQPPLFPGSDDPLGRFRVSLGDASLNNVGLLALSTLARTAEQAQQTKDLAMRYVRVPGQEHANIAATALSALPRDQLGVLPEELASQPNEWLRALGAVLWCERPDDAELGLALAGDPSPNVRRTLARALTSDFRHAGARAVLSVDPRRSIRESLSKIA